MNDEHGFLKHAQEHGYLYAMFLAALSFVSSWFTRRSRLQRVKQAQDVKWAEQNWDQAAQLRTEYKEMLAKAMIREEELRRELLQRDRDLDAKEHLIGNLKMREAARAVKWNTLRKELIERFPDDYRYMEPWPEPNGGTKEVKEAKPKEVK